VLEGHTQNVNGVTFSADGKSLVSVSYDLTLRIWPLDTSASPSITTLPSPLNSVVVSRDDEIAAAGADGKIYFLDSAGKSRGEVAAGPIPVIAMALSKNDALLAAADVRGSVAIIDREARTLARRLVGPGLPVWSVAFMPDHGTLLTGGADSTIRRWNALTGEPIGAAIQENPNDPLAAYAGDRGAEVFRACVACHTLAPDQGNKAGPTLSGIFGRRIATLPGYKFSEPLKKLDIVWTPETVSRLFEIGPAAYTPGTKMPEQIIGSDEDRQALVKFLARVTKR
jgi:cytochrome c